MAIGPVGNVIYSNQMMHLQASKQTDYQNSVQMQSVLATALQNEKDEEVQEVRPAEETYRIDPENEHERQQNDEENSASEEQPPSEEKKDEDKDTPTVEEEQPLPLGHLDVKA